MPIHDRPALPSRPLWPWLLSLAALTAAVYTSSYWGDFFLDDCDVLVRNQSLRPPVSFNAFMANESNFTRPVAQLTFVLDYALFGNHPHPFHILNVLIHVAATLLLFSIVFRSLTSPRFAEQYRSAAAPLAFAIGLLWALHPLQTESVTYIVQRHECLMSLFFLFALYAVIRGSQSPRRWAWDLLAIIAALLGAGCKQVIVVIPFVAILYDRCFISGSFAGALKRAPILYAALLILPTALTAFLVLHTKGIDSAGFSVLKITPWDYARTQFVVLSYYLSRVVYPVNLCVYYAWKVEHDPARIIPAAAFILSLLGVSAWQVWKNTLAGFWAAWFFVILAPTSTIYPIRDIAFEHRLYLPLAGVIALAVLGLYNLRPWLAPGRRTLWAGTVLGALALMFSILTVRRNIQYYDSAGLILDTLINTPHDPATLSRIGQGLLKSGAYSYAHDLSEQALLGDPHDSVAHANLGELFVLAGDVPSAAGEFRQAFASPTPDPRARTGLLKALLAQGQDTEIDALLATSTAAERARVQLALGNRALEQNRFDDAARCFGRAREYAPENIEISNSLGIALAAAGHTDAALAAFDSVVSKQPQDEKALFNRGSMLERKGDARAALADYRATLHINPDNVNALNALAALLSATPDPTLRNGPEALAAAEKACRLTQRSEPALLDTLAATLADVGRFDDAAAAEQEGLKLVPSDSPPAKVLQDHLLLLKSKKSLRSR